MNRSQPSSLVLALLRFVESENEALAGDLVEEWRAGRSRTWFWKQLVQAMFVTAWRRRTSQAEALRPVSAAPFERPGQRFDLIDPATMNLRGFRVRGVGGGGLLGIVMLITIVLPQAWFVVFGGYCRWRRDRRGDDCSTTRSRPGRTRRFGSAHDVRSEPHRRPVPVHARSDVARLATV